MAETERATLANLDAVAGLIERFFHEEGFCTPREQIRRQVERLVCDSESAVFLAWEEGRPVGVATVTTTEGIELGLSAELEDLYVLPEARGSGAGRALVGVVAGWCRARGCSLVSVTVTPEGQAAHDLIGYYRALGFEETGRMLLYHRLVEGGGDDSGSGLC